MKRYLISVIAIALLAGCLRDNIVEQPLHLDTYYPGVLQFDLLPGVRALDIRVFEAIGDEQQVAPGKLLAKEDYVFTPVGLCSTARFHAVLSSGETREETISEYEYDEKTRITREYHLHYLHGGSPDTLTVITIDAVYTYDDFAGTATCLEYTTTTPPGDPPTVTRRVYPLRDNGHVYRDLSDEYSPTRALVSSYSRVIVARDARGYWTEGYLREEHASPPSITVHDYTRREITYY